MNRICPGRDLANHLIPAAVMNLLWAFEIVPVGNEARPDSKNPQFVDSLVAYVRPYLSWTLLTALVRNCSAPAPFRCQFRPRSEKVVRLIQEATVEERQG
jgi:hypothetical protein